MAQSKKNLKANKQTKKPSQADKTSAIVIANIVDFWLAMSNNRTSEFDMGWLLESTQAEKAAPYLNGQPRYHYKGLTNQHIIAMNAKIAADREARAIDPRDLMVVTFSEIPKLFDLKTFKETPVSEFRIKSIGSIYTPAKRTTSGAEWFFQNGGRQIKWTPKLGEPKRPTAETIKALNLREKKTSRLAFSSVPVWSIRDLYDHLSSERQQKVDQLVAERAPVPVYDFSADDPLTQIVESAIADVLSRHQVPVSHGGNEACYNYVKDRIALPQQQHFKNPIAYYAVVMHELAHSTIHANKRFQGRQAQQKPLVYAAEEIVAETTAMLMVQDLESKLVDQIRDKPAIRAMFKIYKDSASTYNDHYGTPLDFGNSLKQFLSQDGSPGQKNLLIKDLLSQISGALVSLKEHSFTPAQRAKLTQSSLEQAKPTSSIARTSKPQAQPSGPSL